jgi:hypothetical protein
MSLNTSYLNKNRNGWKIMRVRFHENSLNGCGKMRTVRDLYAFVSCQKKTHSNDAAVWSNKTKLCGFSPQANYTDLAIAACRRS